MFHLFGNVYLDDESRFATKHRHLVVASKEKPHPINRHVGRDFTVAPAFDEFLEKEFKGSHEEFWTDLLKKKEEKGFVLYCDTQLFHTFQIQYWKSIFEHASAKDVHLLYNFWALDDLVKRQIKVDPGDTIYGEYLESSEFLDFENFDSQFKKTPVISALKNMDKGKVCFEYLMADYFFDPQSPFGPGFLDRIKTLAWKAWFNDVDILKSELSNAIYDIHKIFPGLHLDMSNFTEVKNFFSTDKRVRWITDPEFSFENIPYVLRTYKKELFIDITNALYQAWGVHYSKDGKILDNDIVVNDSIMQTEQIFSEDYLGLLYDNIKKGFGCVFVGDELRFKSNQVFASFLYEKFRSKKTSDLAGYRLSSVH